MAEVANGNDTSNNNSENAIIYLKMLRDASNSLGLTVVIDYMERYTNPFEMLSKEVSPVFTFIGNLYKTVSGGKLHIKEYAGIFSGTLKMINSMIALYDGFQNNTRNFQIFTRNNTDHKGQEMGLEILEFILESNWRGIHSLQQNFKSHKIQGHYS